MCIIAAKPAGITMPGDKTLANMWATNRDGAGFMYAKNGLVHIEKGFMKYPDFAAALDKVKSTVDLNAAPVVLHFRITTHGGTKPENCHPFPVTDSIGALKKLKTAASVGVAHNGIIPNRPRAGISDTMEYVASQLAPLSKALPRFYENQHAMTMIRNAIDSKMAMLTGDGRIFTVGEFFKDKAILYSNRSFEDWYGYGYRYADWNCYDAPATKTKKFTKALPAKWEPDLTRMLMWLTDTGGYVVSDKGEWLEPENFLIDQGGRVYEYAFDLDGAILCVGYTAYTEHGTPARYDFELATQEYVLPGNQYTGLRDDADELDDICPFPT